MVSWNQMPMYVVPVGPGRSRVLWSFLIPGSRKLPPLIRLLVRLKPAWLDHFTRNATFGRPLSRPALLLHGGCISLVCVCVFVRARLVCARA